MFEEATLPATRITVQQLDDLAVTLRGQLTAFPLKQLQQVRCLRTGLDGDHELRTDQPQYFGGETNTIARWTALFHKASVVRLTLNSGYMPEDMDGIFTCSDGVLYIWGLNSLGDWTLATVHFRGEPGPQKRGYQRATEVHFRKVTAQELVHRTGEDPHEIARLLLGDINDWLQERIVAAKEARDLFTEAHKLIRGR